MQPVAPTADERDLGRQIVASQQRLVRSYMLASAFAVLFAMAVLASPLLIQVLCPRPSDSWTRISTALALTGSQSASAIAFVAAIVLGLQVAVRPGDSIIGSEVAAAVARVRILEGISWAAGLLATFIGTAGAVGVGLDRIGSQPLLVLAPFLGGLLVGLFAFDASLASADGFGRLVRVEIRRQRRGRAIAALRYLDSGRLRPALPATRIWTQILIVIAVLAVTSCGTTLILRGTPSLAAMFAMFVVPLWVGIFVTLTFGYAYSLLVRSRMVRGSISVILTGLLFLAGCTFILGAALSQVLVSTAHDWGAVLRALTATFIASMVVALMALALVMGRSGALGQGVIKHVIIRDLVKEALAPSVWETTRTRRVPRSTLASSCTSTVKIATWAAVGLVPLVGWIALAAVHISQRRSLATRTGLKLGYALAACEIIAAVGIASHL